MGEQEQPKQRYFLDISAGAFSEIEERLKACKAAHCLLEVPEGQQPLMDLNGILLRKEDDQRVGVWLIFDNKRLNPPKSAKNALLFEPEPPSAEEPLPA